MASLSEAKIMGGIGAILILLTAIPSFGWIIGIIGFILVLIAIRYISKEVNDHRIFNDMMISVILAIIAVVVAAVTVIAAIYKLLGLGTFAGGTFMPGPNVQARDWIGFALAVIPGLVAIWAILIASAVFFRRSLDSIGEKLNVNLFRTTGLIYLIGAVTTIIVIGFVLILVAEIMLAISFFLIEERTKEIKPAQTA